VANRQLAAVVAAFVWLASFIAPAAAAQYTAGLPPGITSVEVDGRPIDSVNVPTTDNATPEISGRVELGVPTLDLAIANGAVTRFQADVDERGRFRATVPQRLSNGQYTLYINDLLIGAFVVEGASSRTGREPGRLLDIARVVPYPADFGGALPGIGFLDGRFYSLHEEALRTAAASSGDQDSAVRDTERRLAEAGWLQRYESRLAAPATGGPETFSAQFSSFIVEYASGADAKSAFISLTTDESGAEFVTIGDESRLSLLSNTTPDTGVAYQAARLVYRVGPMLGMIVYADLQNQPPNLDLLASVAQAVAARGAVVADRQATPLGSMALRLDTSTATGQVGRRDLYDVRGGDFTPLYNLSDTTRAARMALFSGTSDAFTATTIGEFRERSSPRRQASPAATEAPAPEARLAPTSVISIEGESTGEEEPITPSTPGPDVNTTEEAPATDTAWVLMTSALYAFPDEASADAWYTTQRDRMLANPASDVAAPEAVPDAPSFGDVSSTFATTRPITPDTSGTGYRIFVRSGAIVTVLEIVSEPGISLRGAANLMELQMTCIDDQGCTGAAPLPASLFGTRENRRGQAQDAGAGETQVATPSQ
jgi:hypothetical protein